MFEDKEAYEEDWPHLTSIWRDDAEELIEALRNVARAGKAIATWLPKLTHDEERFLEALDALPGWVLDE